MIFITVGTQKFQLNRLLILIDDMIDSNVITEKVFAQTGNSDYQPRGYESTPFMGRDEFDKKISECSLLITHCGEGTIITGLKQEKPIIVFPRLAKYKEHVDNYQLQLAASFSKLNYVIEYKENADFGQLINEARIHKFDKYVSHKECMTETIKQYLLSL